MAPEDYVEPSESDLEADLHGLAATDGLELADADDEAPEITEVPDEHLDAGELGEITGAEA